MRAPAVPPLLLAAAGVVLWICAALAGAGAAIQTNGVTLLVLGAAWLVAEIRHARRTEVEPELELVRDRRR